jgi:hypothetical protein
VAGQAQFFNCCIVKINTGANNLIRAKARKKNTASDPPENVEFFVVQISKFLSDQILTTGTDF